MVERGWWVIGWVVASLIVPILLIQKAMGSEAAVCPPLGKPVQVEVRFNTATPFVDDTRSRAWIQEKARQLDHPVGLTESRLAHTLTAQFELRFMKQSRKRCIHLRSLSLVLEYPNIKIYIANAYRAGSCEYQAIYRHESEHVRIINTHQERALPSWRTRLQSVAQKVPPLSSDNPQQAQHKILQELDQFVRKEIQHSEKRLRAEQGAIDTKQSYAKVQTGCRGW